MAQISYGTITITDTTDINKIENWYLATDLSSGVTRNNPASGHGTWTTSVQSMTSSFQYLWNYEKIYGTGLNNTNVLISQTDPVIIGRYGQNGAEGNSITSIDEYYQVTNSTTNPGSSGWQKNTLVTPTSTNKYLWNYQVINYSKTAAEGSYTDARIIGVYGDTGPQGPQGNPGTNGINTATVYLYQRATSAPSKPSGTLTYTFSSASITSGTLGNWKQSIGELTGTDPIWVIAAIASSNGTTDTIASSEWSTQIKLAQNGTDGQPGGQGVAGLNQATVFIYKRATSATAPSATTYTFSNGSFTVPSGWSKTIPASDGNPCYVTSAVAIGNGTTATLTWNTPSILVEDGSDGISPTVTSISNGVKIVDANGNETYITNGSNGQSYYTYIRYATDSSGSNMSSSPTGKTYIGVYSGTATSAPTTANSYTWSKYVGDPGTPATQYYAFVKYATDANGSNMQDSPDSTHVYVGTYTGTSSSPAASAYKWSKYVGDPGQPATQYYAFIKYATSSTGANMTDTPSTSTTYVGTYAGTKSSPTASDYKWSVYVGTDGVSVTAVKEIYYLTTGNAPTAPSAGTTTTSTSTGTDVWTTVVPTYVPNGKYYTSIQTTLSKGTSPISSTAILNNALTDENYRAWEALSVSQSANENAIGAMSQAAEAQYQAEALDTKLKTFFWPGDSNYPGAYAVGKSSSDGLDIEDISTYGYNVRLTPATISIGYNEVSAILIDGSSPTLKFYPPSKTVRNPDNPTMTLTSSALTFNKVGTANKTVELTNGALNFYGSSTSTADATLTSTGLKLVKGGLEAGSKNTTDYIYVWSTDDATNHKLTINNHEASDWRIIAGNKFGVDKAGNLYASNADISGAITTTSLKILPNTSIIDNSGDLNNGRNFMLLSGKEVTSDQYLALKVFLSEPLIPEQTYTLQLWGVDVSHSGKTFANLGVDIYYCGGNIKLGGWHGSSYFTQDSEATINPTGHADRLILTFTPHADSAATQDATNGGNQSSSQGLNSLSSQPDQYFLNIYNSASSATGTKQLTINNYKLEKGTTETQWIAAPEDTEIDMSFFDQIKDLSYNAALIDEIVRTVNFTEWIQQEGNFEQLTTEDVFDPGTIYYAYINGRYEIVEVTEDDDITNYYVLSEVSNSISQYLQSHILLEDSGITIQGANHNSRLHIYNEGILLYQDNNLMATFGEDIILGNSSDLHIKISPAELGFYQGTTENLTIDPVAFINSEVLSIARGELTNSLQIGKFAWQVLGNNRITLIYTG